MKKFRLLMLVCIVATSSFAQIKVDSIGRVTNGDTINIAYPEDFGFRRHGLLEDQTTIWAFGDYNRGLAVYAKTAADWGPAIYASAQYLNDRQIAIDANASNSQPHSSGRSYGIIASAGNRTSGYNYGAVGNLIGANNGAAIIGCFNWDIPCINGKYAGYFDGNTYVKGTLTAQSLTTLSDARFKSNIQSISSTALSKIVTLNPVQYNILSEQAVATANTIPSDTAQMIAQTIDAIETNDNTIHYGLVAQEVKLIYPELVHEDAAGVMSINYIEIIPLLIQAIQDLSAQVNALSNGNVKKTQAKKQGAGVFTSETMNVLYQNTPNPFTHDTEIAYTITPNAQSATIFVYDMTGVQLLQYPITMFGEGTITIDANNLYAGSFLYSLVVDGKLIDTKQMVLTK